MTYQVGYLWDIIKNIESVKLPALNTAVRLIDKKLTEIQQTPLEKEIKDKVDKIYQDHYEGDNTIVNQIESQMKDMQSVLEDVETKFENVIENQNFLTNYTNFNEMKETIDRVDKNISLIGDASKLTMIIDTYDTLLQSLNTIGELNLNQIEGYSKETEEVSLTNYLESIESVLQTISAVLVGTPELQDLKNYAKAAVAERLDALETLSANFVTKDALDTNIGDLTTTVESHIEATTDRDHPRHLTDMYRLFHFKYASEEAKEAAGKTETWFYKYDSAIDGISDACCYGLAGFNEVKHVVAPKLTAVETNVNTLITDLANHTKHYTDRRYTPKHLSDTMAIRYYYYCTDTAMASSDLKEYNRETHYKWNADNGYVTLEDAVRHGTSAYYNLIYDYVPRIEALESNDSIVKSTATRFLMNTQPDLNTPLSYELQTEKKLAWGVDAHKDALVVVTNNLNNHLSRLSTLETNYTNLKEDVDEHVPRRTEEEAFNPVHLRDPMGVQPYLYCTETALTGAGQTNKFEEITKTNGYRDLLQYAIAKGTSAYYNLLYDYAPRIAALEASSNDSSNLDGIISRIATLETHTGDLPARVETLELAQDELSSIPTKVSILESKTNALTTKVDALETSSNTYTKSEVDAKDQTLRNLIDEINDSYLDSVVDGKEQFGVRSIVMGTHLEVDGGAAEYVPGLYDTVYGQKVITDGVETLEPGLVQYVSSGYTMTTDGTSVNREGIINQLEEIQNYHPTFNYDQKRPGVLCPQFNKLSETLDWLASYLVLTDNEQLTLGETVGNLSSTVTQMETSNGAIVQTLNNVNVNQINGLVGRDFPYRQSYAIDPTTGTEVAITSTESIAALNPDSEYCYIHVNDLELFASSSSSDYITVDFTGKRFTTIHVGGVLNKQLNLYLEPDISSTEIHIIVDSNTFVKSIQCLTMSGKTLAPIIYIYQVFLNRIGAITIDDYKTRMQNKILGFRTGDILHIVPMPFI